MSYLGDFALAEGKNKVTPEFLNMCSKVTHNRKTKNNTRNRRAFLINHPFIWKVNKSTVMGQWQNVLNDYMKTKNNTLSRRAVFHEKAMELRQTCNRNASERERI